MGMKWKFLDLGWKLVRWIDRKLPPSPTLFPLKFTGIVNWKNRRERVRLAIRHDLLWDTYYEKSKYKRGYWYSLRGMGKLSPSKEFFILQVADLIIEWRLGAKGLERH